ncbi:hypothetical protein SLE2022_319150 [Rubroshorea leprosula]
MLCFSLIRYPPPLPKQFNHHTLLSIPTKTHFPSLNFSQNPLPLRFLTHNFSGYPAKFELSFSCLSSSLPSGSVEDEFDVELGRLLVLLPKEMQRRVSEHPELRDLIEVVMDLGRKPLARFPSGDFILSDSPITVQDLDHATSQVGDFAIDNRAGISRTLHRISAIRNRRGKIIGLTCRVGRAISGSADLLRDLVQNGASLLLIGPPGVGKTTIIRDIARMLANDYKKRVMIVDTSNEIGGDGDIPHAGIGNARRMQVPDSDRQHKVLIEAVENHMPQVIVIDEIGTKLEAMAASTIAQRGIQLVATAHGVTIENLIVNPSLEMLVGGIQSVTLGDEEANRRGVQKTVLERKGPSTFNCGVEIISKTELRVHCSLEATVDAVLAGRSPNVEIRKINSDGLEETISGETSIDINSEKKDELVSGVVIEVSSERTVLSKFSPEFQSIGENSSEGSAPLHLFVYGVPEATVVQGIKKLEMDAAVQLTDNISEADALFALQSKLKKNPGIQAAAKSQNIPIYVTKTSSLMQISKVLRSIINDQEDVKDFGSEDNIKMSEKVDALEEARVAIEQVVIPKGEAVELLPRSSHIISLQMDLVKRYQLQSERIGKGSDGHLRIVPFHTTMEEDNTSENVDDDSDVDDFDYHGTNGSTYSVDRK